MIRQKNKKPNVSMSAGNYVGERMKHVMVIIMCLTAFSLCSCAESGNTDRSVVSQNLTVSDLMAETDASAQKAKAEEASEEVLSEVSGEVSPASAEEPVISPESESAHQSADVDVDLTKLSKTMVYSEVYNIMVNPDDYIGKTIRMGGAYNIFVDETTGMTYYYCVIQDATACCAQGIEFILKDDYKYPDDYPEEGTNVTVVGRFDTYMEGEYMYCTLRDAVLEN
ncbi:MAG: hypothetical protein J5626_01855 [Lachnospiraceae bacterium]|nr:hypothetical protein [Lachnospiraceae bacterium]